jgi:hypothetical protein
MDTPVDFLIVDIISCKGISYKHFRFKMQQLISFIPALSEKCLQIYPLGSFVHLQKWIALSMQLYLLKWY